ncbi:(S)-beta-bisabolene synthase [Platanthera guangdongensis]|uniref:(S)-beta-bisabolene synthase n=1 Tax=Platanthera guangdongensis TaxID=2320717 RepID=A0ABR2MRY8_9ASPA
METLQSPSPQSLECSRKCADYHPSDWGDYFISFQPIIPPNELVSLKPKMDALKAEIFQMFMNREGHLQSLELIDTIQRLGVAYHFEMEISEALQSIYESNYDYHDLYAVSLHFRLLRQQRYLVPTNVFEIFLVENGNFKNCLSTDANGLLSLFEAAHLGMPEEKILDDAIIFSKTHLMSLKYLMEPHFAAILSSALQVPLFRRIDRSKTRSFFINI